MSTRLGASEHTNRRIRVCEGGPLSDVRGLSGSRVFGCMYKFLPSCFSCYQTSLSYALLSLISRLVLIYDMLSWRVLFSFIYHDASNTYSEFEYEMWVLIFLIYYLCVW